MVVEKLLAEEGINRRDIGRENFEKRIWEWKAEYVSFLDIIIKLNINK